MSLMQRADFRRQLQQGLYASFGLAYEDWPQEWVEIYESETSKKAYEEEVMLVGLGAAEETAEGANLSYDSGGEAWVQRYKHKKVTKAFAITEEAVDDGLYDNLGALYAKAAARSIRIREEVDGAAVLNNGFSAGVTWGDGQPLFSLAHPLAGGGTAANTLATSADLSEEALEDMLTLIGKTTDDRGVPIMVRPKKFLVPTESQYVAHRLLESEARVGTALNDVNALKSMKAIPGGYAVNHFFTDPDSWVVTTDVEQGFRHFERKGVKKTVEYDFDTGSMKTKFVKRYSFGVTNWRAGFGSSGSPI